MCGQLSLAAALHADPPSVCVCVCAFSARLLRRMRDGCLRDPAHDEMVHAHYESRAGGFSGADWGDLEYQVALRTG